MVWFYVTFLRKLRKGERERESRCASSFLEKTGRGRVTDFNVNFNQMNPQLNLQASDQLSISRIHSYTTVHVICFNVPINASPHNKYLYEGPPQSEFSISSAMLEIGLFLRYNVKPINYKINS